MKAVLVMSNCQTGAESRWTWTQHCNFALRCLYLPPMLPYVTALCVFPLSPDVVVHVAQWRHELKRLWELDHLGERRSSSQGNRDKQTKIRAFTQERPGGLNREVEANGERERLKGDKGQAAWPASQYLRAEARSSAHTAAGLRLAAWSS